MWKKKIKVASSEVTGFRSVVNACNPAEAEAHQFEEINGKREFLKKHWYFRVRRETGRRQRKIFVTKAPASIVAESVAELNFLAEGASIYI